jgi:hypothetical protein
MFSVEDVKKFSYGTLSGVINTLLFNPYDKALYTSVKNKVPFLTKANWQNPYQGVSQAIVHRIISYGFYYPIMDIYGEKLNFIENKIYRSILSSCLTGSTVGIITTPLSAIKMTNWNTVQNKNILDQAHIMYKKGGIYSFLKSIKVTLGRDIIFGGIYGYLSLNHNDSKHFALDVFYACIATIFSSPLNYVRNIIYQSEINTKPQILNIYFDLQKETNIMVGDKFYNKFYYIAHNKFCIGWGTLRVGTGMALSRQIYILFANSENV